MRYRSKPSEIEAVQWTGGFDSANECLRFVGQSHGPQGIDYGFMVNGASAPDPEAWLLAGKNGAQGWVAVPVGHWIVRQPGDLTDHWPVDPEYFASKYEPVYETGGTE